jgi:NADH:ubiquinone oxidoreductase subunit D
MNQLSKETLGLFATDKAQRFEFANDIVNRVIIGEVDSINIHLQLKAMVISTVGNMAMLMLTTKNRVSCTRFLCTT